MPNICGSPTYRLEFEESAAGEPWRVLSFRVPRSQITRFVPRRVGIHRGDGGWSARSRIRGSHVMMSLWASRDRLSAPSRLALDQAYSQVLATALGAFERPDGADRAGMDAALRATVARFVAFGAVRVEDAAAHVGVSVRKLHKLYAEAGASFAKFVREMRLGEVARELADPTTDAFVTDIAARWGFCDGPRLSRLFRGQYGCTPTE